MLNKRFGEFVCSLRRQRTYFDKDYYLKQWTQGELAQRANLSVRQVAKIEQGEVVDLQRYLEPLAAAFDLTEAEKKEFYACAGYILPFPIPKSKRSELEEVLGKLQYPAAVRNQLNDFVAFNTYHAVLFGYNPENIVALNEGELGPNLLRAMFDPMFDNKSYAGGEALWRENVWHSVQVFRRISFPYVNTRRYRQIIKELKNYPFFDRLWEMSVAPSLSPEEQPALFHPFKVYHPRFNGIEFISLRRNLGELKLFVCIPSVSHEAAYQELRQSIKSNFIHFFDERSID